MAKTKTAAKKPAAKKAAKKVPKGIPQAPEQYVFVLVDGRRLRDVKELADALDSMADHVYGHHVNPQRNDFAQWIEDIFREAELAAELRHSHNKHHAQIILYRHILDRL
jgi:hypothetical protein